MITNWIVTGDTHGDMSRFKNIEAENPSEVGIIILGDAGCNYYLNKRDWKTKHKLAKTGFNYYMVRGNHEARPEDLDSMKLAYDPEVQGAVYTEAEFPTLHYFVDGNTYMIDGHKTLVIGGAYSVDKWYRLQMGYTWFAKEQLTPFEMENIEEWVTGQEFDFVFTHTCPYSWQPTDLFLGFVDQNAVDNSMEYWMDALKDKISWKVWLFGHFHGDRVELPGVEMFFKEMENLSTVWDRWTSGKELDWWIPVSPKFNMEV